MYGINIANNMMTIIQNDGIMSFYKCTYQSLLEGD